MLVSLSISASGTPAKHLVTYQLAISVVTLAVISAVSSLAVIPFDVFISVKASSAALDTCRLDEPIERGNGRGAGTD